LKLRDTEICHCADVLDEGFFVVTEYIYVQLAFTLRCLSILAL
jgi:hypothetical protein